MALQIIISMQRKKNKTGKADLHIHLAKSAPEELLRYVQNNTDLDVIAITDHNSLENALKVKAEWERGDYRFEVILGEEISAKEGHILGIFLKESIPAGLSVAQTIEKIHEQGGLAIAAHPFQKMKLSRPPDLALMDGIGLEVLLKEGKKFDAIEVINATPTLSQENFRAKHFNKKFLHKAETGSSDAHIPEAIGRAYTLFAGKNSEDLRLAIQQCQTQPVMGKWTISALVKLLFFLLPDFLHIAFFYVRFFLRLNAKNKN